MLSHFTNFRLSDSNRPFEARIAIPRLIIRAKYSSSGVLLIIPASGAGDFDGVLDGVVAELKGQVSTEKKTEKTYLHVDNLAMELNVKKVRMHIAKVFKNNRILSKCSTCSTFSGTERRLSVHFVRNFRNLYDLFFKS